MAAAETRPGFTGLGHMAANSPDPAAPFQVLRLLADREEVTAS
jgi:hypothetical protein